MTTTTTARARRPLPATAAAGDPGSGVRVREMVITRELASEWLTRNTHNRVVADRHVDMLARDIANDAWLLTGEAIKWEGDPDDPSTSPRLLDGQHRLWAVITAEKPIRSLVVTGLPPEAQDVMDTNMRRSAKNMLELEGVPEAGTISATASMILLWDMGAYQQLDYRGPKTPTHTELREFVNKHRTPLETAVEVTKKYPIKGLARAVRAFATYKLLEVADRETVEKFFESLSEMKGLEGKDDPRTALLNRLRWADTNKQQIPRWVQANMIFRVWNALQRGEPIQRLQVTSSGAGTGKGTWVAAEDPIPPVQWDDKEVDAVGGVMGE